MKRSSGSSPSSFSAFSHKRRLCGASVDKLYEEHCERQHTEAATLPALIPEFPVIPETANGEFSIEELMQAAMTLEAVKKKEKEEIRAHLLQVAAAFEAEEIRAHLLQGAAALKAQEKKKMQEEEDDRLLDEMLVEAAAAWEDEKKKE